MAFVNLLVAAEVMSKKKFFLAQESETIHFFLIITLAAKSFSASVLFRTLGYKLQKTQLCKKTSSPDHTLATWETRNHSLSGQLWIS